MSKEDPATTRAKAAAFERMTAGWAAAEKEAKRKTALQRVAATGGAYAAEAKRILAGQDAAAAKQAKRDEFAALPQSIEEAGNDVKAFAKADIRLQAARMSFGDDHVDATNPGRANMVEQLRAQGIKPVGG